MVLNRGNTLEVNGWPWMRQLLTSPRGNADHCRCFPVATAGLLRGIVYCWQTVYCSAVGQGEAAQCASSPGDPYGETVSP